MSSCGSQKSSQNKDRSTILCNSHTNKCNYLINLVKSFKFTLKYTIISLLHVSVFNDHHHGALYLIYIYAEALCVACTAHKTHAVSLTLHYTQHTCRSTVSLCTAHNTHVALQSHSALHTTHMPLYSLTPHCTKHICRSTVSLCTAHNIHAALRHA